MRNRGRGESMRFGGFGILIFIGVVTRSGVPVLPNYQIKSADQALSVLWCPGEDSNLHSFHYWYLKPARLPIPPPGLG